MKKFLIILAIIIVVAAIIFGGWYFIFREPTIPNNDSTAPADNNFFPIGSNVPRQSGRTDNDQTSNQDNPYASTTNGVGGSITPKLPRLRLLSNTPVGGYAASTTATSTTIRWIDRGRGNIFEQNLASQSSQVISNTILPRIYLSVWNKNLSAFIASMLPTQSDTPNTLYAELRPQKFATSTAIGNTPYVLKGNNLPGEIMAYATSPRRDKIFTLVKSTAGAIGYVSNFDGTKTTKIFATPLTKVSVEWPEENTLAITTNGSSSHEGYLYFVNIKTGAWRKILGPIAGLTTTTSRDAKYVLASSPSKDQFVDTAIYTVGTNNLTSAVVRTLSDKCVWGNFYKNIVYCAAPLQTTVGTYPDDWYKGTLSTADKIWQIDASTGEVHLVSNVVDQSDRVINAFNLALDPKDEYLFFMNKDDLTLWSFDLVASN